MPEFAFDCIDARSDRYAAGPTMNFRLRIAETSGQPIHAIALRTQIRIEPHKRRYDAAEIEQLNDIFGDASRWADTLKPVQFALVPLMVPSFAGSIEIDLPVPCTYDLDIASTRYFHALEDGEIPLLLLFSGTVFARTGNGFAVSQIPWHKETSYRLPVVEWRAMMDRFFPDSGWLRVSRSTLRELEKFKSARALPTWEHTITALLHEAANVTS